MIMRIVEWSLFARPDFRYRKWKAVHCEIHEGYRRGRCVCKVHLCDLHMRVGVDGREHDRLQSGLSRSEECCVQIDDPTRSRCNLINHRPDLLEVKLCRSGKSRAKSFK